MDKTLILGGYGNFGKRIADTLAKAGMPIVIAGRNKEKLSTFAATIKKNYPNAIVDIAIFDISVPLFFVPARLIEPQGCP